MSVGISLTTLIEMGKSTHCGGTLDCRAGDRAEEQQAFIPLCFLIGCDGTAASRSGHLDCSAMMGCTQEPQVRTNPFSWKSLSSEYFHSNEKKTRFYHPSRPGCPQTHIPCISASLALACTNTPSFPRVCNARTNFPPLKQLGKWFSST